MYSNSTSIKRGKLYRQRHRHEGIVLEVHFEYSNFESLSFWAALKGRMTCSKPTPLSYKIKVVHVPGSKYQFEDLVSEEQSCDLGCPPGSTEVNRDPVHAGRCCGTSRIVQRLHGLLFKFDHSGAAGRFSFTAIPNHLVYALGYVTVIKTVLDLVWSLLFPPLGLPDYNEKVYAKLKSDDGDDGNVGDGLKND